MTPSFASDDPVQALLGWFDSVYEAEHALDPNHPALARYGQGPALADVRKRIVSFRAQGVRVVKRNRLVAPKVSASGMVEGKRVSEVTVCVIEPPNDFVDADSGKPKAPREGAQNRGVTSRFVGVMVFMPDGWHIDGARGEDIGNCSGVR